MGRSFVTRSVGRWLLCGDNFFGCGGTRFCWGFWRKGAFLVWCFGGVGVVICVADVVFWQAPFSVSENAPTF
jgi:hypothetical protein